MIRELLADSLEIWKLPGSVTEREQDVLIHTEGGVSVTVAVWVSSVPSESPVSLSSTVYMKESEPSSPAGGSSTPLNIRKWRNSPPPSRSASPRSRRIPRGPG